MASTAILFLTLACSPQESEARRRERWVGDIDFAARELSKRHVKPFAHVSESLFREEIRLLEADVSKLDDEAIFYRLRHIVALVSDSHTKVSWDKASERVYPVSLRCFADGVFVCAAKPPNLDLVGCRLVSMGAVPLAEVRERIASTISHENAAWLDRCVPQELVHPSIIHALGFSPSLETAEFSFERSDGAPISRTLTAVSRHYADLNEGMTVDTPGASGAISYEKLGKYYWCTLIEQQHAVYFQYNKCRDDSQGPIAGAFEEVWRLVDDSHAQRLIIDLRNNGGGNSALFRPMLEGIKARPNINKPGNLWVLIGPGTFSSAVLNAIELRSETNAVLAGEATGGKPNCAGEVSSFSLPNSGIRVQYSTKMFHPMESDDDSLFPDISIPTTSREYFAGHDPVLETALSREIDGRNDLLEAIAARQGEMARLQAKEFQKWPQQPIVTDSDAIAGTWEGTFDEEGRTLRIVYRFVARPDGSIVGFVDSPDQGAVGIPVEKGTLEKGRLQYTLSRVNIKFDGTVDAERGVLEGLIVQEGHSVKVVLHRRGPDRQRTS
ncbi:MAG: hypothetical protein WC655_12735 [Candidatus Hydrogenedentales bacterium]